MASKIPATFKAVTPFIRRAEELDRDRSRPESQMVAYYCRQYAMELGIKLRNHDASDEASNYLLSLMEALELEMRSLPAHTHEEGRIICENFAYDIFMRADEEDRNGGSNKNTARTFYAAGSFFDILKQFGPPSEDVLEKTKYSKFKAADILKAIKEGRTPTPGAPSEQIPNSAAVDAIGTAGAPAQQQFVPAPAPSSNAPDFPNMAAFSYDIQQPRPAPVEPEFQQQPPRYTPPPQAVAPPPSPPAYAPPPSAPQYAPPPTPPQLTQPTYSEPAPQRSIPSYQPQPVTAGPARTGEGWSQNNINDAMECAKFAAAALKSREVELAIQRLEQALQCLR